MIEQWKDIPGYKGIYQISNLGRVVSYQKRNNQKHKTVKFLKTQINNQGYPAVLLYKNSSCVGKRIHRLIAQLFIDNFENKPHVAHLNGNREDYRIQNLVWATACENEQHKKNHGTHQIGENNSFSKMTEIQIKEIRSISGMTNAQIARKYGVTRSLIGYIVKRKIWKHIIPSFLMVLLLGGCKTAPLVTVCISDPAVGGFDCYDQRTQKPFFLLYKDSDKLVGTPPQDMQTLLNYCAQPGN